MVTSNELLFFFIHAELLSNRSDFLECMIMPMSRSEMSMYCLAKFIESVRSFFGYGRVEVFDVKYGEGVMIFVLYVGERVNYRR